MQDYARPLGDAVKVARNDLKLTQEQVASQTNADPRTIMNIKNYRGNPKMETFYPPDPSAQDRRAGRFYA